MVGLFRSPWVKSKIFIIVMMTYTITRMMERCNGGEDMIQFARQQAEESESSD